MRRKRRITSNRHFINLEILNITYGGNSFFAIANLRKSI